MSQHIKRTSRQQVILDIIQSEHVRTQQVLADRLRDRGIMVTQSTLSRDIRDLGLMKAESRDGETRYIRMEKGEKQKSSRLLNVFSESIISVRPAQNILVIKTYPGMAQAAAAAIDSMQNTEIVGSIAGDDTLFLAMPTSEAAQGLGQWMIEFLANEEG